MLDILSLGAGVQSTAVLLMSLKGELPKLDHVVFADTQWEPKRVYEHLEFLKKEAAKHGLDINVVTAGNLRADELERQKNGIDQRTKSGAAIPYLSVNAEGSKGMIKRQCTLHYKIRPVEQFQREKLGLTERQWWPKEPVVRVWLGISKDEVFRVKHPRRHAQVFFYPLMGIETTASGLIRKVSRKQISRKGCIAWLKKNGYAEPPRSACIGCPYHSNKEWREIRQNPEEWKDAVEFDKTIRSYQSISGSLYIHNSCTPLDQAKLDKDDGDHWGNECDGLCGV